MLVILCLRLLIHSLFFFALFLAQDADPCTWHLLGPPCLWLLIVSIQLGPYPAGHQREGRKRIQAIYFTYTLYWGVLGHVCVSYTW